MRRLVLLVVACLALVAPDLARGGDRPLEITLVDASPPGTEGSTACMTAIAAQIRTDDVHLHQPTLARFLARLGQGDASTFTTWTADVFAHPSEPLDEAVALVDCRPHEQRADVVVLGPTGRLAHMELRGVPIDEARARWLGAAVLIQGWTGFVP